MKYFNQLSSFNLPRQSIPPAIVLLEKYKTELNHLTMTVTEQLERQIEQLERRLNDVERSADHWDRYRSLADDILKLINGGMNTQAAIDKIAADKDITKETLHWVRQNLITKQRRQKRYQRYKKIRALDRDGYSGVEIAEKVDVSPSTVSRVLNDKSYGTASDPDRLWPKY